jgi:hypothetical protein
VKNLVARAKAPKGAQAFVAMWLADPVSPASNAINHRHPIACDLLGVEPRSGRSRERTEPISSARLRRHLSIERRF